MFHRAWRNGWSEDRRVHRLRPYYVRADTQLPECDVEWAVELPVELGLAVELWRARGFPEGGLVADLKLAVDIVKAGAWSI
jgi:hypothetical protein